MLDDNISLNGILVSIEGVLRIEHTEEARVNNTIDDALDRLENNFGTKFDKDIYPIQSENQLSAENVNLFLRDLTTCLQNLSLFIQLKFFHKNIGITLADVNYLGYSKKQIQTSLKYLQDEALYKQHHDDIIPPLFNTLNNINMCSIKRLFIIMLMFDRLGITEGVAIVAQLLYMCSLIQ